MLVTMGRSWLLFVLLALIAVSSALEVKGVEQFAVLNKRQSASGSAASAEPSETPDDPETTPTPTPTPPPPSSSPRPPSTPSPTPTPTPEPSPTPDEPSETPSSETSRATRTSNTPPPANSTPPTSTPRRTTIETFTSPIVTSSVQQFITVVTITRDGSSTVETQTSSSTIALTSQATFTGVPGVNNNDGNGGDSGGLSSSSKKIIGGVVGGVGGAILLGGIAIVCWRIWGRKKRVTEDDADLMAGTGAALGDKPHSANSPFQSNLEQYHTPGGRPNAAANF